ncbi:MAG: glycosyltransferase family 2 protein [Bacteriovoracaceae bacterium]|nr:glycosyltransferase family 2 protein [Bacteriovoracaceae bacterium]
MNSPLISVIIPVFNREQFISRAIESVQAQSFKDWELIIIDDGSTDSTWDVIEKYTHIENIRAFKQANSGVSSARNFGAQNSNANWLAFLDSDDEWLEHKLQKQVALIDQGHPLIHGEEIWIRDGVRVNQPKAYKKGGGDQFIPSLKLCSISPSTVLINKKVFLELGGFREDYPVCEDYDLWLKITSLYEVGLIDGPCIKKYAGHEDQLSFKFKAMDYWRIKSMKWVIDNRDLDPERAQKLKAVLFKKLNILEKGYRKYNNLENLQEILQIREQVFG